jgi:hypothetical protein
MKKANLSLIKGRSLHAFHLLAIAAWFVLLSISNASEVITWNLSYPINPYFEISGQSTNGSPVNANDSGYLALSASLTNSSIVFDPGGNNLMTGASLSGSCECVQDLWVYNQPGQNGPITITVTPNFGYGWSVHTVCQYSLTISQNSNSLAQRQYEIYYTSIVTNNMDEFTFSVTNGDRVTFDMLNQASYGNSGINYAISSSASYNLSVSANGFAANAAQPQITAVSFLDTTHTQMAVSGAGGPSSATPYSYYVLTATNPATPVSNWIICQTNNYTTNGNFSFTCPVNTNEPMRFIRLKSAE